MPITDPKYLSDRKFRLAAKCIHFRGIQHRTCKAGVDFDTVKVPGNCIAGDNPVTCAQRCLMTPEQVAAEIAAQDARVDAMLEKVKRGECTTCGAKIDRASQAGSCIYAEPCGHRIGQGDAKQYNRGLEVHRAAG
jgi:hypothetical protein